MAGEEKIKHIGEGVAKAFSGEGSLKQPIESGENPGAPKKDFVAATTEKLQTFMEKVTKGVPVEAKKIVHEGDRPRDARVLSVVEEIVNQNDETLADPIYMRQVGGKLLRVMEEAGPGSETAREANIYLQRIASEHKSLVDLRLQAEDLVRVDNSSIDHLSDSFEGDALAGTGLDEKLKEYQQMLRYDEGPLHDTHKISQYIEDIKKMGYTNNIPERQVGEAVRRLQAVIDETLAAGQVRASARGRESRYPVTEEDRNWLYDTDEQGNIKVDEDALYTDANGATKVRNRQPLRDELKELESFAYVHDEGSLYEIWKKLTDLANDKANEITGEDVEPYLRKIRKSINVVKGLHWAPNQAEMKKIHDDWKARDNIFYERINNVLRSRFEQSRNVMNLYAESGVDAFIEAVQQQCGEQMAQRYEHLKQSIYFNHDLEQVARSSSGDVEILKKLVHISHTSYMTEATSDPLVVAMISSYEQALRKILRDHDGFLPPKLFSLVDGRVYWDDLAVKFFEAKVQSNVLRDYKRNLDGSPIHKASNVGYEVGERFTMEDFLKKQELRVKATQHVAKGIGVFDHRILELFASAKASGLETSDSSFSSIPYEGIARFFRPHGHLFGKYKMADLSQDPVFNTLFGGEKIPTLLNFLKWSPNEWKEVKSAALAGDLEDWIMNKYGQKKGTEVLSHVKPFLDIMGEFSWTGRFGPHSGWGEIDSTLYWTDRQREMEGGSIRISRSMWWAKRYVEGGNYPGWEKLKPAEKEKKLNQLARAYGAWAWAQMALRSPQIVAENVFMTVDGVQGMGKKRVSDLRKSLIGEILHIDLDKDVSTEATPNASQRAYMDRIAILDTDIAAIQHAALFGGPNSEPREITDDDINIINGDRETERRQQARDYIEKVRKAVLGDTWKTISDVEQALGISFGAANVKDIKGNIKPMKDMLHIANFNKIDEILAHVKQNGGRLSAELIARPQNIFMGMDDTRLGDMDIANLGERAFARLTNDLEARKIAVTQMQMLLSEFRPKMNEKAVFKLLEDMFVAEKGGRGPDSARAFVYYYARLFGEYYRGDKYTKIPIVGRVLQRYGPPSSIAQKVWGKELGTVWSINNEKAFLHQVAQLGALSVHEIEENGTHNTYSLERLEGELVASNTWAMAEMVIIGFTLASFLIVFAATTKSTEEEGKHH